MVRTSLEIECPECGKNIDINEQISHKIQEDFADEKRQLEIQLRKELLASHSTEVDGLKATLEEKNKQLLGVKDTEQARNLEIQKMQHELDNQEQKIEIERKKAALDARKEEANKQKQIADKLAKHNETQYKLRIKELEDRMRQQEEHHELALKNVKQGSVQTQGEGGELLVEDVLQTSFQDDEIIEIKKGQLGADCIQSVYSPTGMRAGAIVWESKRAQKWEAKWVTKVKQDTAREKGDFSVIVSDVLPKGTKSMESIDDLVWVCKFDDIGTMAKLLRMPLIHTTNQLIRNQGKEPKAVKIYEYMTGPDFYRAMKLVQDSYVQDIADIATEENSMKRRLISRKRQAEIRLEATSEIFGSLSVIANEVPVMKELATIETKLLSGQDEE
jgi:hypothetical protein